MTGDGSALRGPGDVLAFWFEGDVTDARHMRARIDVLFTVDPAFDALVRERCGALADRALDGGLADWEATPHSALALLVLLDQVPRNIFRGTGRAFAGDARAQRVALDMFERGFDAALAPMERVFVYMPLEHAEDLVLQERCVAGYEALRDAATPDFLELMTDVVGAGHAHRDVIRRFGRFPHRNAALGRASTDEERAWLAENRGGWGQGAADLEVVTPN